MLFKKLCLVKIYSRWVAIRFDFFRLRTCLSLLLYMLVIENKTAATMKLSLGALQLSWTEMGTQEHPPWLFVAVLLIFSYCFY